jgi:hypothetical protein
VALVAVVLGWGAWHARTHASVTLRVLDHAGRTPSVLWAESKDAALVLRDAAGRTLAEASLQAPHGLPAFTGPAGAVDCHAQESAGGAAWRDCFEAQSRWIASWTPRLATARVQIGACVIEAVPVERRVYSDWWLWWVPLPHVGGTPISYHSIGLHVDSAHCVAVERPIDP